MIDTNKNNKQDHKNNFFAKVGEKVVELIYPEGLYCIVCDSFIDASRTYHICDNCINKILWVGEDSCYICGRPLGEEGASLCDDCSMYERHFDRGFTCATYGLYERKIISDFKKGGRVYLARILGKIMYDRMALEDVKIDGIISIPIYKDRLKERGFNQTDLIGKYLSKESGWPLMKDVVSRTRQTESMKKLDKWERKKNMENAFKVENKERVSGKNILVIDDIFTTGATLDECSRVLKEAGALNVYILTFAAGR